MSINSNPRCFFLTLFIIFSLSQSYLQNTLTTEPGNTYHNKDDYPHENNFQNSSFLSFEQKLVEATMQENTRHIITGGVGNPIQNIRFKISTAICGLWILDKTVFGHGYDIKLSSTGNNINLPGEYELVKGTMIEDQILFVNLLSDQIPILLVNEIKTKKTISNYDGVFGLGYKCASSSIGNINIVQEGIKNSPSAKRKLFSFKFDDISTKGYLSLGGLPTELDQKSKKYREVPLDTLNSNGHWLINGYSIYSDKDWFFQVNDKISVGIGGSVISVKKKFFDYLVQTFFDKYIEIGYCFFAKKDVYEIYCESSFDVESFGRLSLVVDKWSISIPAENLFKKVMYKEKERIWFRVVYYPEYDEYYIAQKILKNTFVLYNQEENVLGFMRE